MALHLKRDLQDAAMLTRWHEIKIPHLLQIQVR